MIETLYPYHRVFQTSVAVLAPEEFFILKNEGKAEKEEFVNRYNKSSSPQFPFQNEGGVHVNNQAVIIRKTEVELCGKLRPFSPLSTLNEEDNAKKLAEHNQMVEDFSLSEPAVIKALRRLGGKILAEGPKEALEIYVPIEPPKTQCYGAPLRSLFAGKNL